MNRLRTSHLQFCFLPLDAFDQRLFPILVHAKTFFKFDFILFQISVVFLQLHYRWLRRVFNKVVSSKATRHLTGSSVNCFSSSWHLVRASRRVCKSVIIVSSFFAEEEPLINGLSSTVMIQTYHIVPRASVLALDIRLHPSEISHMRRYNGRMQELDGGVDHQTLLEPVLHLVTWGRRSPDSAI